MVSYEFYVKIPQELIRPLLLNYDLVIWVYS